MAQRFITKGPWTVSRPAEWKREIWGDGNRKIVCSLSQQNLYYPDRELSRSRMVSDTVLIAAAPELLAILQTALTFHRTECVVACEPGCWCWDAEAQIAKIDSDIDTEYNEHIPTKLF